MAIGWRKQPKVKEEAIDFRTALSGRKIPILTLDERWHRLFPDSLKTVQIKKMEQKVNSLLKEQGKLVTEMKDMKQLKRKLMGTIVENMDMNADDKQGLNGKRLDKSQQLIKDINSKMETQEDELANLPYEIKKANEDLMNESMKICYEELLSNKERIQQLDQWILRMREELKNRILEKQDMETRNEEIYSYMHALLGPEIMENFDKSIPVDIRK